MDLDPVEAGRARLVMRDMTADRRWRRDHDVTGLQGRHEDVEIGERAGADADLGMTRGEDLGRQLGADDLDALDGFEPHLVFVAGISQRGPLPQPRPERRLGARIHRVGRGVEVDAVALVDPAIGGDQLVELGRRVTGCAGRRVGGDALDQIFAGRRNPGAAGEGWHRRLLLTSPRRCRRAGRRRAR
jgi:hypothetical protein